MSRIQLTISSKLKFFERHFTLWAAVLFILQGLLASTVLAEESSLPKFHLETGKHLSLVRHISVDVQGQWLATVADDKTARIWDLAAGTLLRTFRLPSEPGDNGHVYSVALSPDGVWVAVGGGVGQASSGEHAIYVFHRLSGRLERRLTGLPAIINRLQWSPDGRWLAASLGKKQGIRVYRADTGALVDSDTSFPGDAYGLAFDGKGHLAATSYGGLVRLYLVGEKGLERLTQKLTLLGQKGLQPRGIQFSPDGSRIAVGYTDSLLVNVFNASDLEWLFSPDTSGLTPSRSLLNVAWSKDGNTLYAAGSALVPGTGERTIRIWSQGGQGHYRDLPAATNIISDLAALPKGGIVFSSSTPTWGVFNPAGQSLLNQALPSGDFRAMGAAFRLSQDGGVVSFGFEGFGKSPATFSLAEFRYLQAPQLNPPSQQSSTLKLTDWDLKTTPRLNGNLLPINAGDVVYSAALAPGDAGAVIGSAFNTYSFDASGQKRWFKSNKIAYAINVSADGRWVVVAHGDGVIRWYRYSDGMEALAFFPHKDGRRWVVWSPSGYYHISQGGEELFGWETKGAGDGVVDFRPAAEFRSRFHRPDVIARILETGDEATALKLANRAKTP